MFEQIYWSGGKRAWDVLGAACSLALAALPLAVCMALIRLETTGPALLRQWRIGRDGRPFRIWKLRTMHMDAEANGQPRFAAEVDGRATRMGDWLRAWHGDELPQLWNVLCGDMSLVGPRPERAFFVDHYRRHIPGYDRRHCVRPGITGLAQVRCGYAASLAAAREKTAFDLEYLALAGWSADWRIWCHTWRVAFYSLRRRRERRHALQLAKGFHHARPHWPYQ